MQERDTRVVPDVRLVPEADVVNFPSYSLRVDYVSYEDTVNINTLKEYNMTPLFLSLQLLMVWF